MPKKNYQKEERKVKKREKNSSNSYGTPRTLPDCPPKFPKKKSRENKQGRRREKRSSELGNLTHVPRTKKGNSNRLDTPLTRARVRRRPAEPGPGIDWGREADGIGGNPWGEADRGLIFRTPQGVADGFGRNGF